MLSDMGLGTFILRAFMLTPFVFLRMLPVTIAYIIIFGAIILSLAKIWFLLIIPPFGLGFLLLIILMFAFYEIQLLRAGLASLGRYAAPTPEKLMSVSLRQFFFYRLGMGLISLSLVAIPLCIYFALRKGGIIEGFKGLFETTGDASFAVESIAVAIFLVGIPWYIVTLLLDCLFSVPMAANAARASKASPNYDPLFGLGRQFLPVFCTIIAAILFPFLYSVVVQPFAALTDMEDPSQALQIFTIGTVIYLVISFLLIFVPYTAKSLAFVLTVDENAQTAKENLAPIFDMEEERQNISSMRRQRTKGASGVKVYDANAHDTDERRAGGSKTDMRELRKQRTIEAQAGGVYDPNNPGGKDSG